MKKTWLKGERFGKYSFKSPKILQHYLENSWKIKILEFAAPCKMEVMPIPSFWQLIANPRGQARTKDIQTALEKMQVGLLSRHPHKKCKCRLLWASSVDIHLTGNLKQKPGRTIWWERFLIQTMTMTICYKPPYHHRKHRYPTAHNPPNDR